MFSILLNMYWEKKKKKKAQIQLEQQNSHASVKDENWKKLTLVDSDGEMTR